MEPSVNFYQTTQKFKTHGGLFPPSELSLPPKYLLSAGPFLTLDWPKKKTSWTRMRISICAWRVCILCLWLCVWRPNLRPLWLRVVNYGREEAMRSRSLNLLYFHMLYLSALWWLWLSSPTVVYLVQAQTEKGGSVVKDLPGCKLSWPERELKSIQFMLLPIFCYIEI